MSAFAQLCEPLRHGIVHRLRWRELRPVQELALVAVLGGHNAVVLAPTAGGKTEAAMFPVLHRLYEAGAPAVGALYLSPLRALLNNQEPRMRTLARLVGMEAFKWHGDVSAAAKRKFLAEPCQVLMITPESLEVMLMTPRYDKSALFGRLRFAVVDEIHAFAGDDRGAHLMALLERLTEHVAGDVQRLGLSATVGDPEQLLEWLQGSSGRTGVVVRPPMERTARLLDVVPLRPGEAAAAFAARWVRRKKALFFAEARRQVEELKQGLEEAGVTAYAHHGSLSRELREESERAFRESTQCCIACTSTLELGLDVGDLDAVLQLDSPGTVSAFLQRLVAREGGRGRAEPCSSSPRTRTRSCRPAVYCRWPCAATWSRFDPRSAPSSCFSTSCWPGPWVTRGWAAGGCWISRVGPFAFRRSRPRSALPCWTTCSRPASWPRRAP